MAISKYTHHMDCAKYNTEGLGYLRRTAKMYARKLGEAEMTGLLPGSPARKSILGMYGDMIVLLDKDSNPCPLCRKIANLMLKAFKKPDPVEWDGYL